MRHEVCWWGEADQADLTPWPGLALQEERSAAVEEAGSCCVVPLWTGADEISRGVAGVATGTREGEGALKHVLRGPKSSQICVFPKQELLEFLTQWTPTEQPDSPQIPFVGFFM